MTHLYVIECENKHFYIGQTNNINRRLEDHFNQNHKSSLWTKQYKPVKLVEFWDLKNFPNNDAIQLENKLVLEYINKYGIEKVRGGMYIKSSFEENLNILNNFNDFIDGKYISRITNSRVEKFNFLKQQIDSFKILRYPNIYCLELEDGKFFIGKTNNLTKIIKKHVYGKHFDWSTLYEPINIVEVIFDSKQEYYSDLLNDTTIRYMQKFGWRNVRGGHFQELEEIDLEIRLNRENPELLI